MMIHKLLPNGADILERAIYAEYFSITRCFFYLSRPSMKADKKLAKSLKLRQFSNKKNWIGFLIERNI